MINFIQALFSDDSKPDIGAVCTMLTTLSVLLWVSHVVWHTHSIPDLTGPATFVGVGAASHYGVNKVNDVVSAWKKPSLTKVPE